MKPKVDTGPGGSFRSETIRILPRVFVVNYSVSHILPVALSSPKIHIENFKITCVLTWGILRYIAKEIKYSGFY